jgi:Flp pilus assembly protein TadB
LSTRTYLSWLVAFLCAAGALVVLGAPLRSWAAFFGIALVIVVALVLQAIARRRRTR